MLRQDVLQLTDQSEGMEVMEVWKIILIFYLWSSSELQSVV